MAHTATGKKKRRHRIVEVARERMIHLSTTELTRAMETGSTDPVNAIREGNGLPSHVMRTPTVEDRAVLLAALETAGIAADASGALHEVRTDGVTFKLASLVSLQVAADPPAVTTDMLRTWHEDTTADIARRLPDRAQDVQRGWAKTCEGPAEGVVTAAWPMSVETALAEGRRLGAERRDRIMTERRLDALGFSDLRLLHREQPLPPRRIVALMGPTNSGKTHEGLGMLERAETGAYLAPLRLLAMENHESLNARGIACDLVTGEEFVTTPGATHVSSTIEMLDLGRRYDVVLIDEIQMLADEGRGWAWTRALLSVDAGTVVVAGSEDSLPLIRGIARITGDEVEVRRFERKSELRVESSAIAPRDLRAGDAVIAFTRRDVLAWKETLDERGMTSAVIYGALGPDVRRAEAARFRSGAADVLVATDAIGMGLNLPIRRVVFTTATKFDGKQKRQIAPTAVRQIAGRAGRYGHHAEGVVGAMTGCDGRPGWLYDAMSSGTTLPRTVHIAPTWTGVRRIMADNPEDTLLQTLDRVAEAVSDHALLSYRMTEDDRMLLLTLEEAGVQAPEQFRYMGLPLSMRTKENRRALSAWLTATSRGLAAHVPDDPLLRSGVTADAGQLQRLEILTTQCGAYAWLARKFPDAYPHGETARRRRDETSEMLGRMLAKGGLKRSCRSCGTTLPAGHRHMDCPDCHD